MKRLSLKKRGLLTLTTLGFIALSFVLHPTHVAISTLQTDGKGMQITHKFFLDDLENALKLTHENISLTSDNLADVTAELQTYLSEKFSISRNDKAVELNWVGYEREDHHIWVYQEVSSFKTKGSCKITSKFIMELFDDQNNITHILDKEKEITHSLVHKVGRESLTVEFE
jgi:hypothetical protein